MSTSLNKIADLYPPLVGWAQISENHFSSITLNGANLSQSPENFPLQSRIRLYENSQLIGESITPPLKGTEFQLVSLNNLVSGKDLSDTYFEVTVFSETTEGLQTPYFNEVWASVVSTDGKTAVNYPLLLTRGASPALIDASYLYYPGMMVDKYFNPSLVILNHFDFTNEFDITLYDASGDHQLRARQSIPPKSLQNITLENLFPNLESFFKSGPGMLVFHYKYKLNAYVQTRHRQTGILSGMDHLGVLFALEEKSVDEQSKTFCINRMEDGYLCYCKKLTRSALETNANKGSGLESYMNQSGAGLVCRGCIPDLEKIFEEKSTLSQLANPL